MPPRRVLVDLLGFTGSRGGTETYVRELTPRLAERLPHVRFAALTGRVGADKVRGFFPGHVQSLTWVGPDPGTWALGAVAATAVVARRGRADLVWAPANFGPIFRGAPRLVTVHDAIYDEVPGTFVQRAQRTVTSTLMRRSAQTADRVLTVSHAAAASIERHLGVAPERIAVVHNGSTDPRPVDDPRAALIALDLPKNRPVILSVGNRMPHKNFVGLLEALATLPAQARPLTVIAGSRLPDPLTDDVSRLGLDGDVLLPGWVSDNQLEALFQVADLYVCASLVEGFGLPVIDALRRDVPVLANDVPVLREVGGDAARYADATSPEQFGTAITRALNEPADAAARAAAKGWAARFTWDDAADATAAVLEATLAGTSR
ncbi:glycosyltransferase family 4 protein [Microbacterium thalli]|uniref:glycosyltransferase family 4 protein n=1 Tax=Microbacterium thalli TaxID=3027921 RepID=UPI002365141F|nr:glycosyltransferase family 1 protein [Microbacterium thalli]MDD7930461.1 glycosyltransferase family 1 protein [Microbacterium thalli]